MAATASRPATRTTMGANLVALSGLGLIVYGMMFLYRNFNGFIELGLTPAQVGGTPEQIQAFSMHLYHYIMHLQIAIAAFLTAMGVGVIALARYGIRAGQSWAVWTAFAIPVIGVAIALPPHYMFGFATLGHLGLIYADATILLVGTVLALRELKS